MTSTANELKMDSRTFPDQKFSRIVTNFPPKTQPEISIMINSHLWFFNTVFILVERDVYLLIVQPQNIISFAKKYKTLNDARLDFLTLFPLHESINNLKEKGIDIESKWTDTYQPNQDWLEQKYKQLSKYYSQKRKILKSSRKRPGNPSFMKPTSTYSPHSPHSPHSTSQPNPK